MDMNVQIIEAVKRYPVLYGNRGCTISERDFWWKKLSDEIQINDQHVKGRWHILRQQYIQCLELEHEDVEVDFKYKDDLKFLLPYVNVPTISNEKSASTSSYTPEFQISSTDDDLMEDLEFQEVQSDDSKDFDNQLQEDTNENPLNILATYDDVIDDVSQEFVNEEIPWNENKDYINVNVNNETERSEDVIFGELVTAMLQKMTPNTKRSVKKEIMNLLLN